MAGRKKPTSPRVLNENELKKLEAANEGQEKQATQLLGDDETRQSLARKFVNFYFLIMALIIVGVPVYNVLMQNSNNPTLIISIKDALLTYSAIAGPTLGLVVAYYFKSKKD